MKVESGTIILAIRFKFNEKGIPSRYYILRKCCPTKRFDERGVLGRAVVNLEDVIVRL